MSAVTDRVLDEFDDISPEPSVPAARPAVSNHEQVARRREMRSGAIGAVILIVALIATGVVYAVPWGQRTYHATLSEAQMVRVGDGVRVAGIDVGRVTALRLLDEAVEMDFTVDSSVFIGDQTTIDIRMLTLVGGHYLALFPAGETPLGTRPIQSSRITTPYSLIRTLQDAAEPVRKVNGDTLRMNIVALNRSLRSAPGSYRNIGHAAQALVGILERQNEDVSKSLAIAEEYLSAVDANKSLLGDFIRKVGVLTRKLLEKKDESMAALVANGETTYRIAALEPNSRKYLEPLLNTLTMNRPHLEDLVRKYDGLIRSLQQTAAKLVRASRGKDGLVIDQSAVLLLAPSEFCVPVPGRAC